MTQPRSPRPDPSRDGTDRLVLGMPFWIMLWISFLTIAIVGYCIGLVAALLAGWEPSTGEIVSWAVGGAGAIIVVGVIIFVVLGSLGVLWRSRREEDL